MKYADMTPEQKKEYAKKQNDRMRARLARMTEEELAEYRAHRAYMEKKRRMKDALYNEKKKERDRKYYQAHKEVIRQRQREYERKKYMEEKAEVLKRYAVQG